MSVLLLDFESTGIDTKTARVTEIGAMITDMDLNPSERLSQLVWAPDYPTITPEVTAVTGITQEMLDADGVLPDVAFGMLGDLVLRSEVKFVIAYSRNYDENLFRAEIERLTSTHLAMPYLATTPWLCAMVDIESNYQKKCWKLSHLALDYGVAVDPKKLHRAINDVELMREMMGAAGATPMGMYEYQRSPWIYVVAKTRAPWEDNGKSTGAAKELGFSWQQCKGDDSGRTFDKRWVKRIKHKDFAKLQQDAGFEVALIGG